MEVKVEIVGEYTEEHARRVMETSYRIWKRVLRERAAQGVLSGETIHGTQTQNRVKESHGA